MHRFHKIAATVLCLLLASCAIAEINVAQDALDQASLEDLYALRERIDERIAELERGLHADQVYPSGYYQVGDDIPAGYYVVMEAERALFSSLIIRSQADEAGEILAHELILGQAVVKLTAGTYVTFADAVAYPMDSAPDIRLSNVDTLPEGGYWVGTHLEPGTYVIAPMEKAPLSSYSVFDDVLGTDAQLVKFEKITQPISVELEAGQYLELSGCTLSR